MYALAIVIAVCIASGFHWYNLRRPLPGIPHRKGVLRWLVGDTLAVIRQEDMFGWLAQQCTALQSPIIQMWLSPFDKPVVVISDFREAQDILVRRGTEFDRAPFMSDILEMALPFHSLRMLTNDQFKFQRKVMMDTMTPAFLHQVAAPYTFAHAERLVRLWQRKAHLAQGRPFTAGSDLNYTTLDFIWVTAFGAEVGTIEAQIQYLSNIDSIHLSPDQSAQVTIPEAQVPPLNDAIEAVVLAVEKVMVLPFPRQHHRLLKRFTGLGAMTALKEREVSMALANARQKLASCHSNSQRTESALDFVLRRASSMAEKSEMTISDAALKDELFGFILGGQHTSATTTSWALKTLSQNPGVQDKLRTAIDAVLGAETFDQTTAGTSIATANMPYVDAFIEEVLRFCQIVPGVTRVALADAVIFGHAIPAGTEVFFLHNGGAILEPTLPIKESSRSTSSQNNRDKTSSWNSKDISEFDPERWLTTDAAGLVSFDRNAGPALPFAAGNRGCFGKNLALMNLRIMIAVLVHNFDFNAVSAALNDWSIYQHIARSPRQCYVQPSPRQT
ncbi:hypothetical protein LTR17_010885 [Elasticomyces elasticus]|nr:hypothetical protein LTR17_010885 [Elasticomyces elasticus]